MRLIPLFVLMLTLLNAQSSREALLIGNYKYSSLTDLDNPSNNLKRLKSSLEDVDFRVKTKVNLNDSELEDAIEKFKKRLSKDRDTIGFLYYTGHGCQVDYQGYLLPTNVNSADKLKVKYNAMNINKMLETLTQAGNRINLIFLDACRDVPTATKGGTKGLGQPTATAKGSLVVYATEAGKVANDNAKFINALIENINKPNQYLRDIADNISNSVAKQTSYVQIPEVFAKLLPKVVLKDGGGGYVPQILSSKYSICQENRGEIDKHGVCSNSIVRTVTKKVVSKLSTGLIAYYKFEGNANDSSGNENHGIEYSGVRYVEGIMGKSAKFDGIDDYIKINTNKKLRVLHYSISFWIKTKAKRGAIFSSAYDFSSNAKQNNGFDIQINKGKVFANNYTHSTGNFGVSSLENINILTWKHIVITWNGDKNIVYLNGVKNNT